jgi:hypothetical protein
MIAVAIAAIVLVMGILKKRRDERLEKLAFYSGFERKYTARAQAIAPGKLSSTNQARLDDFRAMGRKWERASSHPWESVEPDP